MLLRLAIWLSVVPCALGTPAFAQSVVLNYEGRVSLQGTNFNGPASLVFSIHDANGAALWSSASLPTSGATNPPAGASRLILRDGRYRVRLGGAGMPALDALSLRSASAPFLRVWFNDGSTGWCQLPEDTPLQQMLRPLTEPLSARQGEEILREIRELRNQMAKQPAPGTPQTATVNTAGSPMLGNAGAPVVLVEFTDFQCPYCKRAQDEVIPALRKKYVETGKLRIVSRQFPLEFHTYAEPAAMASLCAMQQGQYWPMRERLFAMNTNLSAANFLKAASELHLNTNLFAACLRGNAFATQLSHERAEATAAGITGTPTFVLGRAKGETVSGTMIVGIKPLAFFEAEVEKLLNGK